MPAIKCPDQDSLDRFATGRLDDTAIEQLGDHLTVCESCRRRADAAFANSDLALALHSPPEITHATEQELRRVKILLVRGIGVAPPGDTDFPPLTETADDLPVMPEQLGPYRLTGVLGKGGMGMVYLAEDTQLGRQVALKVMKARYASDPLARRRFVQEGRAAATLTHDHIVPIYQVGEDHGVAYIAMPLLHGRSLDDLLKKSGRLSAALIINLGSQMAEGLKAAHEAGLIHRDIKPANIWIEPVKEGRVKILDFGLARSINHDRDTHLTQSGVILGTPEYMAPEQAQDTPVDHRCDLFSLGCVLYRMATGALPFPGKDTMTVLMALATKDPVPPHKLNIDIPRALSDLIMRLLAKDPARRPQTADEVIRALAGLPASPAGETAELKSPLLDTTTNPARTTETWMSPVVAVRGRRLTYALLAGLLIALGGVGTYQFVFKSADGTLVVEVDDAADVRFRDGKVELYGEDGLLKHVLEPGVRNKSLPPGRYQARLAGADGLKLQTDQFEMTKNGRQSLRVTAEVLTVAKVDPPPIEARPESSTPALCVRGGHAAIAPKPGLDPLKPWTMEAWITPLGTDYSKVTRVAFIMVDSLGGFGIHNDRWYAYSYHGETDGSPVEPNRRVHIAVVRTVARRELYVDGKLVAATLAPIDVPRLNAELNPLRLTNFDSSETLISEVRISQTVRYEKEFKPASRFVTDKDTVALYHLDEGQGDVFKDSSGNNRHGKVNDAEWRVPNTSPKPETPTVVVAGPAEDYALRFETPGKGVEVPTLKLPADGPLTVEGYVTVGEQTAAVDGILMGCRYQFNFAFLRNRQVSLFGKGTLVTGEKEQYAHAQTASPLVVGRRYHIAGVRTATEFQLYVDGKPVRAAGAIFTKPLLFVIGENVAGDFDEIRVSKAIRYTKEFQPPARFEPDADTLALYHCDEGTGDRLKDSSGHEHHGTITGGKWVRPNGAGLDPDRRAAVWLRSMGPVELEIIEDFDAHRVVPPQEPLPEKPFRLNLARTNRVEYFEKLGDGLADKAAVELKGVRLKGAYLPASMTAAGMDKLLKLPTFADVEMLSIYDSDADDGIFTRIAQLPRCYNLDLNNCRKITGKGIRACSELQLVTMFEMQIPAETLEELGRLPHLRYLNITRVRCDEKRLAAVVKLKIPRLIIGEAGIDDAGAARLAAMEQLEQLNVPGNPITDKGLAEFKKLKNLQSLYLSDTKCTAAGVADLQKALPACRITWK